MKTTLELPDELMRGIKVRAARTDRSLKDVVADLIRRGLEEPPPGAHDPLKAWAGKLVVHADGSVTNPDGVAAEDFIASLESIRDANRSTPSRDPFAGHAAPDAG